MLNITNHQGNVNQDYNEIILHAYQDDYYQKRKKKKHTPKPKQNQKMTGIGEDMEKLEPSFTVGGGAKWCSLYRKKYGRSSKN